MKSIIELKRLSVSGLALCALGLTAGPVMAKNFYLCAKPVSKTFAGEAVPMWGFAKGTAANFATGCGTAAVTVPGPNLSLGQAGNAAQTTYNINLYNGLPVSVSLVIDGVSKILAPEFFTDGQGRSRMRSLDTSILPGSTGTYTYSNVTPGTYLYGSGTHIQVQRPMGLYGAAFKVAPGTKQAYPGVGFDRSTRLLYSAVDPDLNNAVDGGTYGTAPWTSTLNFNPKYHLINGQIRQADTACIANANPLNVGDRMLLRAVNAGSGYKTAQFMNTHVDEVAESGYQLPYPRNLYSVKIDAGSTKDVILTATVPGDIPFIDGFGGNSVNQTGSPATANRGAQWCVAVAAVAGAPTANADSYGTSEGGSLNEAAPGVLSNDTDGGTPPISATLVSGPAQDTGAFNLSADGSFSYTHNGSETTADSFVYEASNANGTSQATVNITITPVNDPPVALDDSGATDDQNPVTVSVLSNDTDVDGGTLNVTIVTQGTSGSVTFTATEVTYTPIILGSYLDSFDYTVDDGNGGIDTGTVSITVTAFVNVAPNTVADFPAATRNDFVETDLLLSTTGTTTFNILGNDSDDGVSITPTVAEADFDDRQGGALNNGEVRILGKRYKIGTTNQNHNPAANGKNYLVKITKKGGIVAYDGFGNVIYKPARFFVGTDIFNYRLKDKDGALSDKAKVKITVAP